MKAILITITILLSAAHVGRTQYVYWNQVTPNESNLMNTTSCRVELQDQVYFNFGCYGDVGSIC